MDRRDFLVGGAATALGLWARPAWARAAGPVLVLVELNGGPDTLQMVMPKVDAYRSSRPGLAVDWANTAALDEATRLNDQMAPLLAAWAAGQLAVVRGVGYAPPNRSHFRSIEIWNQADERVHEDAWLPRLMARKPGAGAVDGLVLGGEPGPLGGAGARTLVVPRVDRFLRQAAREQDRPEPAVDNPALAHVLAVRSRVNAAASDSERRLERAPALVGAFPKGGLGQQLQTAARVIAARAPLRVIKLRQGGYDTHAGQTGKLNRLMAELAAGLAALREALIASGDWDRTLVMTYAEFGRRVRENGSRGTDHGTAATHFVLGGRVKGGLYGRMPSLVDLAGGDLKHHVDFRRMYADAARHLGLSTATLGKPLGLG